MREYEDRAVIRWVVAPPPLPGVVRPGSAAWREHVAAHDPGADILKATLDIARYLIPAEKLGPALQSGFEAKAMMPSVSSSAGSSQSNDIPEFPDMPVTQSK